MKKKEKKDRRKMKYKVTGKRKCSSITKKKGYFLIIIILSQVKTFMFQIPSSIFELFAKLN